VTRRFDLIVFDWDGTIMDSTSTISTSIQRACADLGLAVPSDEAASHVIGLGLHDALAYAVPDLPAEQLPRMVERYRHHYLSRDGQLCLFVGIDALLAELRGRDLFLAVATGKSRVGLDRALAQSGLGAQFDMTRAADESRPKPHPDMLYEISDALGVPLSRTLMVGDTTHDLLMAANARAASLGVSYGAHPRAQLAPLATVGVVDDVAGLRTALLQDA
jgi:phosphoglycolate phosphatase